ncbi:MAG TPA: alkaline phosphatase family protein [Thermoanaerobaculia bacterium]|nr:alkaline phosphatase family protein [Thermoanaerobaculia bacterium]
MRIPRIVLSTVAAGAIACGAPKPPPPVSSRRAPVEDSDVAVRSRPARTASAPVIWIGLDGLDPDWMNRLSAEGKLPNWSKLVAEGASAKLASYMPMLSPIVWTTMATGVGPDLHRVLDFQEIDPATGEKRPVSGASRALPAIWNVASAAGRRVGVVGWWATDPAEIVSGFFVSDRAFPIAYAGGSRRGTAFPPALDDAVRAAVARDGAVAASDLAPAIHLPESEIAARLGSADGMKDPVFAFGRILASTRVYQRLARDLYDRERPDFMTVYFEGTDAVGHVFASDTPPRLACVSEDDVTRFGSAAAAYFAVIDRILGQWMRRAAEDGATLVVTSDHGFKWGTERPCERSSSEWSTAAYWHRPDGLFAAWGARVSPGVDRGHPSVFDVAPTVLALLNLPPDVRMRGRGVTVAFRDLRPLPAVRELDRLPVDRVAAAPVSAAEQNENAKKLVALGYLSPRDTADLPSARRTAGPPGMTEGAWNNLGLYERETVGNLAEAEKDFRKALDLRPGYHSPLFNLAILYRAEHRDAIARDYLFRALAAGHADPAGTILSWASEYRRAGDAAPEIDLLRRAREAYPADEPLARALGDALFRHRDCAGARSAVAAFSESAREPETLNALGLYETCLGNRDGAAALFHRSLAMKPAQPGVIEALRVLGK